MVQTQLFVFLCSGYLGTSHYEIRDDRWRMDCSKSPDGSKYLTINPAVRMRPTNNLGNSPFSHEAIIP